MKASKVAVQPNLISTNNPSKTNMQPLPPRTDAAFPVDLIRTVAIVLVIFLHAAAFPYPIPTDITPEVTGNWWTVNVYGAIGRLGVPLFVMLSGALLLDSSKADEPLGVFFKKRFNRIGLPMFFWSIAYFAWDFHVHYKPLTIDNILQGTLSGAYVHLWFLYLLVGLYLVTPVLRVLVKHLDSKRFKYLLTLWFVGTVTVPFINTFGSINFNPVFFVFSGWIGIFLLGTFLQNVKVNRRLLILGAVLGLAGAVIGAYFAAAFVGERVITFFHESLSFNMIVASVSIFLLLTAIPSSKVQSRYGKVNRLLCWISQNTLPIYLFHIMVLESLEIGFLGLTLNRNILAPIIEVPLITILTLILTCLIIYPLNKIPIVKRVIG